MKFEKIHDKFIYSDGNFQNILNFWKEHIKVDFYKLSDEVDMMIIDKKALENIYNAEPKSIPVDCRIFAHMYSQLNNEAFHITLIKNSKALDCMVPNNCYYLTIHNSILDEKEDSSINLRICLESSQGQWLTKVNETEYVGILDEGVKVADIKTWCELYCDIVLNKLDEYKKIDDYNLKKILSNMLFCKLKILGLRLSLYSYDFGGRPTCCYSYTSSNRIKKENYLQNSYLDIPNGTDID